MTEHTVSGVGEQTIVTCSNGGLFGPASRAEDEYSYCPYCGEDTDNSSHRVDVSLSEVFCDESSMSNYRFCPNCGDRIEE